MSLSLSFIFLYFMYVPSLDSLYLESLIAAKYEVKAAPNNNKIGSPAYNVLGPHYLRYSTTSEHSKEIMERANSSGVC